MIEADYSFPSHQSQLSSNISICSAKMPLLRRRRPVMSISSSPVNTVDAQGTAYLCFPEDHSWFQGNISTDDESNYSLYGERIQVSRDTDTTTSTVPTSSPVKIVNKKDEKNNNADSGNESDESNAEPETDYYRVTMIDHFSGLKHVLPKIVVKKDASNLVEPVSTPPTSSPPSSLMFPPPSAVGTLFTSQHGEVTFQVENVYKGQKADIMINRYLGSPSLLGKKCLLYSGNINILFNDIGETGRSWSL